MSRELRRRVAIVGVHTRALRVAFGPLAVLPFFRYPRSSWLVMSRLAMMAAQRRPRPR